MIFILTHWRPFMRLPVVFTQAALLAANRWTDNVFAARSWCLDKLGGSCTEEQFNANFGVPSDFDYLPSL